MIKQIIMKQIITIKQIIGYWNEPQQQATGLINTLNPVRCSGIFKYIIFYTL